MQREPLRTFGKVVDGQLPVGILGEVLERDLGFALSDHHMHNDEALEDNGPSRVAQAVGEGAEDFGDACLACVRRDKNVLDIFGFGCGELRRRRRQWGCRDWGG